nr:hypothetical protein CFP56_63151 [Quercus suber]
MEQFQSLLSYWGSPSDDVREQRLDVGGLWQMGGLRKDIDFEEEDVCWWVWWVFICDAFLLVCRGSDRGGADRGGLVDGRQGREGIVLCKVKVESS